MAFASGKNSYGICDISGFRYKLREMRKTWDGLLVGPDQWDAKHPQLQPKPSAVDPQAVKDPRPDKNLEEQRSYQYGFDPVGLNNPLQLEGLVDNLESNGQIGSVTITTT